MTRRSLFALPFLSLAQPSTTRPNVVILLADDLGWADVGFHASEIRTPNIDKLAREGVQLDRFYSFPVCSPTRSALMTGRSPMRLGVIYGVIRPYSDYGVPADEHFMPESFRAAGYETAYTGKWHLGHGSAKYLPNRRGFDHAYGHMNGAIDYFTHIRDGGLDWNRDGKSVREEGYSTELLANEAIRLIQRRNKSKPLFLYMPFNAPHAPLQAPAKYLDKYAQIKDTRRRSFCAMVDALDENIGRVLTALDEQGMTNNTLVLFFSDNGGPVNQGARNTPLRGAKASTWEGGTRVPAIMRWPNHLKPGTKSSQVMQAIDVFPTLAAAVGVKPGNRLPLDGRNLWANIQAGKAEPREDLLFAVENGNRMFLAIHHGDWKLVREVPSSGGQPENYLFRIAEDPTESKDLAAANPEIVKDLVARLQKWQALSPRNAVRHTGVPPPGWKAPAQYAEAARPD
ncbi:MAG TPA: arylsulfatase [Bryobacteraceae bacterium]|nr:arylsulfatase [Bryobacteraceae bacterium]